MLASMGDVYPNSMHIAWSSVYSSRRGLAALYILVKGQCEGLNEGCARVQFPRLLFYKSKIWGTIWIKKSILTTMDFHYYKIEDCEVFIGNDSVFLLEPETGSTLLLSKTAWQNILQNKKSKNHLTELLHAQSGKNCIRKNSFLPQFFMIDLTTTCSNRCTYCFRNLQHPRIIDNRILNDILNSIINYCKEYNIKTITLQVWGGEPLSTWDNICLIQDKIEDAGIKVRLLVETNGVLVTPQIAANMYHRGILCSISIDGPQDIHDYCRKLHSGNGSYKNTIRGLNLLRDAGYGSQIGSVCVVTRNSIHHIDRILDHFAYELKFSRIKLNIIKDNEQLQDKDLCIDDKDLAVLWETVLSHIIRINQSGTPFVESTILSMLHNLTTHRPTSFCYSRGCQAGQRMLSFDMEGNAFPCDQTDVKELSLGNALLNPIDLLVKEGFKKLHSFFAMAIPNECCVCAWRSFCQGGCRTIRWFSNDIDRATCIRNKTLYPQLVRLILEKPLLITAISGNEIKFE